MVGYAPSNAYSAGLGLFLGNVFGRSAAEISAGVTPTNYEFPVGNIRRYGADPTGVALCNAALTEAKAVSKTVMIPAGTFRVEAYDLQDLRLIGCNSDGANYGTADVSVIQGSGDIFTNANNFSLEFLTIKNTSAGTPGKLISVKDIDTSIGPIRNCRFLRANYHIYQSSTTRTIVGAAISGCLFREALIYSRYYANQGLFQYSEIDCYTGPNKRGLFVQNTSTALIAASVFEFQDEGAVYVDNTVMFADAIKGLKFQNIHFEQNGNVTPSADVTIHVTNSLSRIEFDCCGFYASTLPGNVDLAGCADARIFEHECNGISYNNVGTAKVTQINAKIAGETSGVRVTSSDIKVIGGKFVGNQGVTAQDGISARIFGAATPTPVPAPTANSATLVVARDITTNGAALLLLTPTTVNVVSSSLTSIVFTVVAGFLNGQTTGGSSFRDLYFNHVST